MAAPAFEMSASTTRTACAVALRLERAMRRGRARIALRGFVALRATRFLGSHDSCGAREACKIRLRARFSSVIAYARYYFVIDANKVPLQCGQEARQSTFKRSPTLHTAQTATFAGRSRVVHSDSRSTCTATTQRRPTTQRRRRSRTNGSTDDDEGHYLFLLLAQPRAAATRVKARAAARHILYSSSKRCPTPTSRASRGTRTTCPATSSRRRTPL